MFQPCQSVPASGQAKLIYQKPMIAGTMSVLGVSGSKALVLPTARGSATLPQVRCSAGSQSGTTQRGSLCIARGHRRSAGTREMGGIGW